MIQDTSDKTKEPAKKQGPAGCLALILIFVVIFFSLYACMSGGEDGPPNDTAIYVDSQFIVEGYLKAPSTAKYPGSDGYQVIKIDDHNYKVAAYVDSENSFGAMVRNKYVVDISYNEDWSTHEATSVIIDAQKYL